MGHEKSSLPTSELSAGGAKGPARQGLPAIGRLWPSDVDDLGGVSDDVDDVDRGDDFGRCSTGGSADQDSLREPTLHRS